MSIDVEPFVAGGRDAGAWRLANDAGIELRVAGLGGAILSLLVPDRDGRPADVVLGYAAPESYETNPSYMGVIVGRYANRIAHARFTIDGREYRLERNQPPGHLHGGVVGFSRVRWRAEPFERDGTVGLVLEHVSPDGAGGYPGELHARVTYTLTGANELVIDYEATTDAATHVNLTQHSYFNLAGHDAGDVLDHLLTVAADRFVVVDETLIPTGELRDVTGTPFDFRAPTPLGARIDSPDEQMRIGHGYDHCLVRQGALRGGAASRGVPLRGGVPLHGGAPLRGAGARGARDARAEGPDAGFAARLAEPRSGRVMTVHTSEPGMQLYTGNWLGDGVLGKGGARYGRRSACALETQHFPDSPNRPEFPSTLLPAGGTYRSRTVYAFGVE